MCVNSGGSVPPVSADLRTTATITTTGANAMSIAGVALFYGITFNIGTGATGVGLTCTSISVQFIACAIKKNGTTTGAIVFGNSTSGQRHRAELINTTFSFGAVTDAIAVRATEFIWADTPSAIAGAVFPTTLFTDSSCLGSTVELRGVDLSALGSGKTLFADVTAPRRYLARGCKLGASVTVAATPTNRGGARTDIVHCDSGATTYRSERYWYEGVQSIDTTIVRTGGASDGTTPIAWKFVTTANAKRYVPFESQEIAVWNDTVGSPVTATVYGIWGGGAVPNNDEIWLEASYLGSASSPLMSPASGGPADLLATAAALASDSSTWGGSTTAFKMTVSFTPQMAGWVYLKVKVAKASSTFYVDPKAVLS